MNQYRFQSDDFGLSDNGVHLLRSHFNFKTIRYEEVRRATIERASEIKNATLILLLGVLLACFAFYQTRAVIELFTTPSTTTIYMETIVLPVIPGFLGVYCIYIALRKGPVLKLEEGRKEHKLRLRSIFRDEQAFEFERYLSRQLGPKLTVDRSMMNFAP